MTQGCKQNIDTSNKHCLGLHWKVNTLENIYKLIQAFNQIRQSTHCAYYVIITIIYHIDNIGVVQHIYCIVYWYNICVLDLPGALRSIILV